MFFDQFIKINNRTTNLILSLTYNFGRNFDDYFEKSKLENEDIILELKVYAYRLRQNINANIIAFTTTNVKNSVVFKD